MKIVFWKQRLARTLAACGMLLPSAAFGAPLNTNLVLNAGFEDVDTSDIGPFTGVRIFDWEDADQDDDDTYAYPYSSNYSGAPAPPGADDYHYTGGFNTTPGEVQVFQRLDLSSAPSGALVAAGNAAYNLSAFFSTYRTQVDSSRVRAVFLDGGDGQLQTVEIGGSEFVANLPVTGDQADWGRDASVGLIPAGTESVEIQVVSDIGTVNHDGYLDLVDFQVSDELRLPVLDLTIERSGTMSIANRTGEPVDISGYSIKSSFGGLDPGRWRAVADNYDADNDQSVDSSNIWTRLSSSDAFDDLSEADLDSGFGTTLVPDQVIDLGPAWIATPVEDVVFQYSSGNAVVQGFVSMTGHGGQPFLNGDLNLDGAIDAGDWQVFREGQHRVPTSDSAAVSYLAGDLNGDLINNHTDFVLFRSLFDEANGAGAFEAMISVPEPSCFTLLLAAAGSLLPRCRRDSGKSKKNKP